MSDLKSLSIDLSHALEWSGGILDKIDYRPFRRW
jgi:hypothetical protein